MSTTHSIRHATRTGLLISGPIAIASIVLFVMFAVTNASASTDEAGDAQPDGVVLAVDDEEDADAVDATAETDAETVAADLPTITYEVIIVRDPFEPVRPEPEPDPDDPTDPDDPDGGQPTDPDDPDGPQPVDPDDPDDPDAPRPVDPLPVTVLEVGEDSARVQVGDTIYDVQVGEEFAGRYVLDAIVGGCARITDLVTDRTQVICVDEAGFK